MPLPRPQELDPIEGPQIEDIEQIDTNLRVQWPSSRPPRRPKDGSLTIPAAIREAWNLI